MLSRGQNGEKSKIRRKEFSTFKIVEIVENSLGKSAPMPETGDFGKNGQSVIHISHIAFCGKPPIRHFWAFFTKLPYFSKYRTAACSPLVLFAFVIFLRNRRILRISFCSPLPFSAPAVFLRFSFSAPAVFLHGFLFPLAFFSFSFFTPAFLCSFPAPLFLPSFSDGRNIGFCRDRRKATVASGNRAIGLWVHRAIVRLGIQSRNRSEKPRSAPGSGRSAKRKHRKQTQKASASVRIKT